MKRAAIVSALSLAVLATWAAPARAQDHENPSDTHGDTHDGEVHEGDAHGEAAAHEHGEHGAEPLNFANFDGPGIPLVAMLFNFAALMAILVWLGKKPLAQYLQSRHVSIRDALADAQQTRAEAEARYKQYSERLDHLDRELGRLREEMSTVAQSDRDRIVADAEERAARLQRESEFLLSQELKQVRKDLERDLAVAAITAAEEVLRRVTTGEDQARLAEGYLDVLGKNDPGQEGTA